MNRRWRVLRYWVVSGLSYLFPWSLEGYRSREPTVTFAPSYYSGQPCIRWRLSTDMFAEIWWDGHMAMAEISRNWPGIRRKELLVACWYEATYGGRNKRNRAWKEWGKKASSSLWNSDYEGTPLPPQRNDEGS